MILPPDDYAHRTQGAHTHRKGKKRRRNFFFFFTLRHVICIHHHFSLRFTLMKSDQSVTRRPYNKKVHRHLFLAISYLDLCILEWLAGRPLAIKAEIKTLRNSGCYKSLTIQSSRFSFCYISRAHHQHIFIALIHNL